MHSHGTITMHIMYQIKLSFAYFRVGHFTLNTMRYLFPGIIYGIFLVITRQSPQVEFGNIKSLVAYCMCCTISALAIYISVVYIPLATAQAIFLCSGLIMTLIAFGCFIGNTSKWIEVRKDPSSLLEPKAYC